MDKINEVSCWIEEPLTLIFDSDSNFNKFCSEASKLQRKLLDDHLYNSVSSFIRFYQEYKAGDIPMPEFYHNHVATHHPNSNCCVGNAMVMRDGFLDPESYFTKHYPDLERYLYFACSNIVAHNWLEEIPEKHRNRPPIQTAPYKEHVLVAFKISLKGRIGYVLIDIGYHMSSSIVVMADGKPPHTELVHQFWRRGPLQHTFKLLGSYIHWIELEVCENPSPPGNRWIYVARKFTKLQEVEKRTRVHGFHAMAKRGLSGPEAAFSCIYGKENGVSVYIKAQDDDEESSALIVPFDYLMSGQRDNREYEDTIAKCAVRMGLDEKELRGNINYLAEIEADKAFFEPMMKLHGEYWNITENGWKDEGPEVRDLAKDEDKILTKNDIVQDLNHCM